ncbi:MAG: DUF6036 family nucleotidyltransferase, partial [Candidatus Sumerlaeota bacterium]|nr:DUF6036 family nucleotidyltransferase [Candidatus Sumerlaeota bacterium]
MSDHFVAGLEFQSFFQERGWPFCIVGGVAILRWGELRATADVDITLFTDFGNEELYINEMLGRFRSRAPNALEFALTHRVLLLLASNGMMVDVALGGLPYERQIVQRASLFEFLPGFTLMTCSAEDLVVMKSFAGREKDWRDVESILIRQQGKLDWKYINEQLSEL